MSNKVKYAFNNPTLEAMNEKLEEHREELIQHMVYVSTEELSKIAECRGMLVGYDNVLKAFIELDRDLIAKDQMV